MNYRDDMVEHVQITITPSGGLKATVAEDAAVIRDVTQANLVLLITDGMSVADPTAERQMAVPFADAQVSDDFASQRQAQQRETAAAALRDGVRAFFSVLGEADGTVTDEAISRFLALASDSASVTDEQQGMQAAVQNLIDMAVATSDYAPIFRFVADEIIQATDEEHAAQLAILLLTSALQVKDDALFKAVAQAVAESSLIVTDETRLHIEARLGVTEEAVIESCLSAGAEAMAWTANVSSWATSRYLPYDFDSIAVIDGHLYGTAKDGIYRLDDSEATEEIHAMIRTGQIDVSLDVLARLESVYCLYEARADITLAVEQTQAGDRERYEYDLPDKDASVITTNRWVLGKGLKGRTFTFELNAIGEKANFLELDILAQAGKRRL